MTSTAFARITIGGALKRADLHKLIAAIEADRVALDERQTPTAVVEAAIRDASPLALTDERPLGQYQNLERACQALGLAYVRGDFGCVGEWSPAGVRWMPGMTDPDEFDAGAETASPILQVATARSLLAAGQLEAELDRLQSIMTFNTPLSLADN